MDFDFRRKTKCCCLRATSLPVASAIWYASWPASYCCTQSMKIELLPRGKKMNTRGKCSTKMQPAMSNAQLRGLCCKREGLPMAVPFPFPLHRCLDPWKVSLPFCGFKAALSVGTKHLGSHSLQQLQQMLPLKPSVKCNWVFQKYSCNYPYISLPKCKE